VVVNYGLDGRVFWGAVLLALGLFGGKQRPQVEDDHLQEFDDVEVLRGDQGWQLGRENLSDNETIDHHKASSLGRFRDTSQVFKPSCPSTCGIRYPRLKPETTEIYLGQAHCLVLPCEH
jgi:hypothetical protein